MSSRKWTEEEYERAKSLRNMGRSYTAVGEVIGRSEWAVRAYFRHLPIRRINKLDRRTHQEAADPDTVARLVEERNKRWDHQPRDLTGTLLGDPPAGYSALDTEAKRDRRSTIEQDKAFQEAMYRAGYEMRVETTPGTDHPTPRQASGVYLRSSADFS